MSDKQMFDRYIGIDYSGEGTPLEKLPGLAVYCACGNKLPGVVRPRKHPGDNWTRKGIAERLVEELQDNSKRTLVGIDHAFSFPWQYFQKHGQKIGPTWMDFLVDFVKHWPTDKDVALVRLIREGSGMQRSGQTNWRRVTDLPARVTSSVFRFQGRGQVGHSTHAGIPWLLYIRRKLPDKVHFWPFDGLDNWEGKSVIAEVYPSLWNRQFSKEYMTQHQHDAYSVARWLSGADHCGTLEGYLKLKLNLSEAAAATREGWILGIPGSGQSDPRSVSEGAPHQ